MHRIGLALLLLCLSLPGWAIPPAPLQSNDQRVLLGPYSGYLEDAGRQLSFAQVSALPDSAFTQVHSVSANLGKNDSAWWFRVRFDNQSSAPLGGHLEVNYSLLDNLQLYQSGADGKPLLQETGDTFPFSQRPVKLRNFWFPVELPRGTSSLLLRVDTTSTVFVPMAFSTYQAGLAATEIRMSYSGLFYGLLAGLFCYNLFLFISLRERVYLWYLTYSLSIAMMGASFDGLLFQLLPENVFLQSTGIYISMFACAVSSVQFSRFFLHTPQYFPRIDRLLQWVTAGILLCVAAGPLIGLKPWSVLTSIVLLGTSLLLLLTGVHVWRQGLRYGSYYTLAWSVLLASLILVTLGSLGIELLTPYSSETVKLGSAIEMIVISIGLADRINTLKEEGFRALQKATEATVESHAKSRFLAKMSHEIRTPLNGVLGMLQLLRETSLERTQRFYLDTVLSSGDALLGVINNLIDYARLESGRLKLEEIDFDLEELLSDTLNLFTAEAMKKRLHLYLAMEPAVPRFLRGDPTRLKQVLMNLLGNALKFTESGHVSLHASLATNRLAKPQLHIRISDSGIGIEQDNLRQLFQSFAQAETSTTRHYGGSGLGLAISKELVEMMEGSIEVQSTPQQGSTFLIKLPLHAAQAEANSSLGALSGQRALLASLDARGLGALELLLQRFGMECQRCLDPQSLASALRQSRDLPLLVLMEPWAGGSARQWLDNLRPLLKPGQPVLLLYAFGQNLDLPQPGDLRLVCLPLPVTATPLRSALAELAGEAPAQPLPGNASGEWPLANILVAEDNQVNQLVIQGLLKQRGYNVRIVGNGLDAVNKYRSNPGAYQLILMDCEMPQMDGFSATREIRAFEHQQQLPAVPVIALTALQLDDQRALGLRVGMSDFLAKPIDSALLYRTLERHLHQPG
ncbi:hybrid sensor histidine kinase/response regulator [Pseudomonas sp. N040]|uniref:hybrid sensor histidine kinase/response regulator n=1 Tax=Pseudomonas sp. N040 TaxID=2785325 RepID=UPI0018A31D5D|nr:hybrid sensor histidine kinase/response regulator [Pseudomonas sp. N040]MBF7729519.1 response regulator [Pseudomonas sp. N040]MBW7013159.1 response regulator [Pseudomonas sp. N040]